MDIRTIPAPDAIDERVASTTVTSFRVIGELHRQGEAGVSDIATALDLAKGTVHKHLSTLHAIGYVVKDEGTYRLGLGFLGIGTEVRRRMPIYKKTYESVTNLAETTGETASVLVPEHGFGVYVMRMNSDKEPEYELTEGESVPLHATAGGKAILAYMPREKRDAILDQQGLPAFTEETITDREELEREIYDVHDRRTAHDRGELQRGRHCLAAPVTDKDDHALGAVTLSGPADRMRQKSTDTDLLGIVQSTANSLRNKLIRTRAD